MASNGKNRALELSPYEYYGRTALSRCDNAQRLLHIYDQLAAEISNIYEYIESPKRLFKKTYCKIVIPLEKVTQSELKIAYNAYLNDYPQHFWLPSSYTFHTDEEEQAITKMVFTVPTSKKKLLSAIEKFEQAADAFLEEIPLSLDEYETEKAIHDKLILTLSYNKSAHNRYNAYGALIDRQCVCEGYSEIFQYLLYKRGILAVRVTGESYRGGGHAWNIVRINDAFYHVDVTWDDAYKTRVSYAYFNLTTEQILKNHTLQNPLYPLPHCTDRAHNYAYLEQKLIDPTKPDLAVECIARQLSENKEARVYLNDTDFDFKGWYYDNIASIAAAAGIKPPYSYSCGSAGYEYTLTIKKS